MRVFILSISIVFLSCEEKAPRPGANVNDSTYVKKGEISSYGHKSSKSSVIIPYVWSIDFYDKTKTKNPKFKPVYLNIDTLIEGLNQIHPNILLEKIKISGDTLFTAIKDSEYLGERIGRDGAFAYIADIVINLTSISSINFVKIDFEDGSHISPGTWNKKEYSNYKVIP